MYNRPSSPDRLQIRALRVQLGVRSSHVICMYSLEVLLLNIAMVYDYFTYHSRAERCTFSSDFMTHVCLCISNVASFTLPCYITTPCSGCEFKYWSYQMRHI